MKANQQDFVKAIEETCVTCGGPHSYYECLATGGNTFDACAAVGPYNQGGNEYRHQGDLNYYTSNQMGPPGFPPPNVQNNQNYNRNTVANPRGDLKAITTRSGVAYDGPMIPPPLSPFPEEVERETEANKDKPEVAPKPNPKPSIPYPSRLNDQKLRKKANNQMLKFLQIFQRLHFDISFAYALLHMPKFASTFKSLIKAFAPETYSYSHDSRACKSIGCLSGRSVAEDVFVKVGKFYFLADFVIVDYNVDPRVPLIPGRPFLRTARVLIDVHGKELTLRVNDEAITFKVGHTLRYSHNYYEESVKRIDVIDVSCEDDFILEEIETFLRTPDELSTLDDDFDPEGDIDLFEKLINKDPSLNLPLIKNEDLKQVDVTMTKPSIKELPELEPKDLPSQLEYVFLEGTDKLPVIISKELKDEEKATLLKVLKSHKWTIAWKISDIKGIDPRFCTHKIIMEDDFKPSVQHQRKVNPKIHEVIKKEVIKLLDAGLIYPISDSP
nr:reverse transcriptase domain-containing protein [Tanacetum cinerariifolium]